MDGLIEKEVSKVDSGVSAPRFPRALRRRILSIAAISSLGFIVYGGIISSHSNSNARLLEEIESHRYPLQAHLISALHKLELVQSAFQDAVITGDPDSIELGKKLAAEFKLKIRYAKTTDVDNTRFYEDTTDAFNQYYSAASDLAEDILNSGLDMNKLGDRGFDNSRNYDSLMLSLSNFRDQKNLELTQSVHKATKSAQDILILSFTTGALAVLLVLGLALKTSFRISHRINNIVQNLKNIASTNADTGVRIELSGNDEMTELSFWFNTIIEKIEYLTNRSTEEIKKIAYSDSLTNLPNRRSLMETLENDLRLAAESNENVAVFIMDLDNFKPVNDEFGHDAGDKMISDVANRLNLIFQTVDHQSENMATKIESENIKSVVGRIGGDEFMAIVTGYHFEETLFRLSEAVISTITMPFAIKSKQCNVGVSVGISQSPNDCTDLVQLIGFADLAMYEAKKAGKNQAKLFDEDIAERENRTNKISNNLATALADNEFYMVFQPKYNLKNCDYLGAEALIRWESSELGFVSPLEFISIAETSKFIVDLDDWVLDNTCAQIARWKAEGLDVGTVSINVSARQICEKGYSRKVDKALVKHGVLNTDIQIEITETSALYSLNAVTDNVDALHKIGVTVAMDDFGAGHSSLQLLISCPIDTLKVDKSLIDQIRTDDRSLSIVKAIVSLGKSLGIQLVAEGIEEVDQNDLLASLGCEVGQGYWFSKPLDVVTFKEMLKKNKPPMLRIVS